MSDLLKIAHLYPDLLNLYGDRGNIIALIKRLEWRGIRYEIDEIRVGEHNKKFSTYHLFFIGGGQDSGQELVARDLSLRTNEIKHCIETGAVMLGICGGYQLMGLTYETSEGFIMEGVGALEVQTKAPLRLKNKSQDRLIGNVSAELLIDLAPKTIVGFENHSGRTYIVGDQTKPLAKIIHGFGNNAEDGFEGAYYKNLFGTYLHGSLLPKNPHFADEILKRALEYSGHSYFQENSKLKPLDDNLELAAHKAATLLN